MVRKIILWFFLVASPLLPIIIFYFPTRSTVKIIRNEFLRWLLYAPLFSLFLSAIVIIWKSNILVLPFNFANPVGLTYPTAISILVGGPGQTLSLTNSLNNNETFTQFIVALLMLWVAILMPFILLQILLEFLSNYDFGKNHAPPYINNIQNNLINNGLAFLKKPQSPGPLPVGQFPAGEALKIPKQQSVIQKELNLRRATINIPTQQETGQQAGQTSHTQFASTTQQNQTQNQTVNQIQQKQQSVIQKELNLRRATINIPTQQETGQQAGQTSHTQFASTTQQNQTQNQTVNQIQQNNISTSTVNNRQTKMTTNRTEMIARFKPEILTRPTTTLISFPIPTMRDIVKFESARLKRTQEGTQQLQQTTEALAKIANPQVNTTSAEKQYYTNLREKLTDETTKGDVLAKSILSAANTVKKPEAAKTAEATASGAPQVTPTVSLPTVNQIQTVGFDDYEAVKDLWLENYLQIDIPPDKYPDRKSWIEDDGTTVSEAITLLSSPDPVKVREGLSSVSNILPFLLIGGFSQTEVIAYLKAKLAAGKSALQELAKKEESEETLVEKGAKKAQAKELSEEVEADENDKTKIN